MWWSDWFIPLLFATGFFMICKGGWIGVILLWVIYLGNGIKSEEEYHTEENKKQVNSHCVIGLIIIVVTIIVNICISLD